MRVLSAVVGVFVLALSAPAFAGDGLRVVDLTGQFDRFAMATSKMPDDQRIVEFEKQIGPIANGFYSRERSPYGYDFRILVQLKTYPERREGSLAVSRRFNSMFAPALKRFEAAFGPLRSRQPVYLIDSLGELDGGTRELGGKITLLFGADVIAELHSGKDMAPFFYHELFHLYHEAKVAKCATVRCALWDEGLATYVASRLAPDATDDELVLNQPEPIRPAVEADRKGAVCAVVRRLDSIAMDSFSPLFMADDNLPGFPPRMGYYLGYLVASDIGRTRSFREMAAMSRTEAQPLIDASLARMATCGQDFSGRRTAEARERSRTDRAGR